MTTTATAVIMNEDVSEKEPVVDLDRITSTYAELKKMEVRLDPNPI